MQAIEYVDDITIDPEFRALIPPLSPDEYAQLEANLLAEGCRDALVVWRRPGGCTLVDGHNRYQICQQHGIAFETAEKHFETREDVKVWIVDNQLGRRNLTAFVRAELALKKKDAIAAKARVNQLANLKQGDQAPVLPNLAKRESVNTRAELALEAGVSNGTLAKVEAISDSAPESIKDAARSGDLSIDRAYRLTKALETVPGAVWDVVVRNGVEHPDLVPRLAHLHTNKRETWDTIVNTGTLDGERPIAEVSPTEFDDYLERAAWEHRQAGRVNTIRSLNSSESVEWYTPARYIEAARLLMGAIDIDPASCEEAQRVVKAARYYTVEDDGLAQAWAGRVWLNPPYGKTDGTSNQYIWSQRLIADYRAGRVAEAVLLVASKTGDQWFQPLWDFPICFPDHRIDFYSPEGQDAASGTTHSSALVYFGTQPERFAEIFAPIGSVVLKVIRRQRRDQQP